MNFIIVGLGIAVLYLVTSSNLVAGEINMTTPGYKKFGDAWVKYDSTFRATANFYGVPFKWLKAIAIIESALGTNERVKRGEVSYDGKSYGFMQFRLSTAQDFDKSATVDKLNQAEYSIDLAGQYLSYLSKMFGGDEKKVIMSYNQGQGNTQKGKQVPAYHAKYLDAVTLIEQG